MLLFFVLCDNKCYILYHLGLQKIFFTYRRFRDKTIRLIEKIISILICDKKKIAAALFTFSSKMRVFVLLCFWFWLQRNVPTNETHCVCLYVCWGLFPSWWWQFFQPWVGIKPPTGDTDPSGYPPQTDVTSGWTITGGICGRQTVHSCQNGPSGGDQVVMDYLHWLN